MKALIVLPLLAIASLCAAQNAATSSTNNPSPKNEQIVGLKAGHFEHFINTHRLTTFEIITDFPVTIREHGCLRQNIMHTVFQCPTGADVYVYDQRSWLFSIGAPVNMITIKWDKNSRATDDDVPVN